MKTLQITKTELIDRKGNKTLRYPNLNTVLMVETLLEEHRDKPMQIAELKRSLPKQVMHQTLLVILEYLWRSGKIIYGPRGVQWIYLPPEHLKAMMQGAIEV
jgi:hypothetical protein